MEQKVRPVGLVAGEWPRKISDLYGRNLAGWQVATCYFLDIFANNSRKAILVAMGKEETDAVVALHQEHVWQAWRESGIKHRGTVKTGSFIGLVNPDLRIAFNISSAKKGDIRPIRIFLPEDAVVLQKRKKMIGWKAEGFGLY